MSEIFNFSPSPSHPRATLRETQHAAAGAQLGPVEENTDTDDANTPTVFQRTAPDIFGRPYISGDRTTLSVFGRGQHAGFIQAQHHPMSQWTPPVNQTQIEDPFEGSVHSFDNTLNARDFGDRFLHPHVAESVGTTAGYTYPLLDQT